MLIVQVMKYLAANDIIEINRKTLEMHDEADQVHLNEPGDLHFIIDFVKNHVDNDYYEKSLAYCISIIVLHPFKNGNHRTSLYSAERYLILNGYEFIGTVEYHKELQKWRLEYEEEHELERRFAGITFTDNQNIFTTEIKQLMSEEYGKKILSWLKENYKLS